MQQMEWREALDEAPSAEAVEGAGRRGRGAGCSAVRDAVRADLLDERDDARGRAAQAARADVRRRACAQRRSSAGSRRWRPERAWRCCRSPNPARAPTRTSAASRWASTWAPRIRWWPRCATAWPNACPTTQGRVLLPSVVRYLRRRRLRGRRRGAGRCRRCDPENTIASVKRLMGRELADLPDAGRAALRASSTAPAWWRCARGRA